ncbi:hybrid sensor histidine kinase/response regulator [Herbaspirillum autotrophicum]|uniref:hybrid sensor histidine kinase/response regulator n=1 Tax=Herbaspirillum autotrophicum TaxID=180195 RepID=UPI00067CEA42|nr:hybrid sensor histidine kinase/response regulator [Herbaspirillum autotrophicum]
MSSVDLQNMSMLDLFRLEAETQSEVLNKGLLELERHPTSADLLESCMRAAHSLKGAARTIELGGGVTIAHAMEDCFVLAQQGKLTLRRPQIDALLQGVDLLNRVANPPGNDERWVEQAGKLEIERFLSDLGNAMAETGDAEPELSRVLPDELRENNGRVLRVTADNLNRLLSLSGESLVESRWLKPFAGSMLRLKRQQRHAGQTLDTLHQQLATMALDERTQTVINDLRDVLAQCQHMLADQLSDLEAFDRRSVNLSQRLYDEALACRMRPFSDGTGGYARMVRDVGHSLGKKVRLEIIGENTQIDRDILEKLDAPLGHLLRNAIDHGIEPAWQRDVAGKPEEAVVTLEARHSAGMLLVNVSDDGGGIDLDHLRATIVQRKLANQDTVELMSESELLEFLLLPSFTMRDTVTEISGRGVGLDVVHNMLKQVRGTIDITNNPGQGTRFQLKLPLTLSVIRSLLVLINDEPYAFPLAYVNRTLELQQDQLSMLEGYQHFTFEGRQIGLVSASQILQVGAFQQHGDTVAVVVIGNHEHTYGLAVDAFLGERMLVVQPLDTRLGKVPDVSAGALMEDGAPVLILDVDDMIRSVEKLTSAGKLETMRHGNGGAEAGKRKRVLVVDDSLTVRELERKLLTNRGYQVVVAVDGMDGWNAVRTESFDLVITDIDMPRMDGIELVSLIRKAPNLQSLPVMIVSYKDREEDRQRGMDAGADYYFTKSSFHDETLLQAVTDLIGEAGK